MPVTSFKYQFCTVVLTNFPDSLPGDNLVSEPSGSTSAAMSSLASTRLGTGVEEILKAILDQQSSIMKLLDAIEEKLQPIQTLEERVVVLSAKGHTTCQAYWWTEAMEVEAVRTQKPPKVAETNEKTKKDLKNNPTLALACTSLSSSLAAAAAAAECNGCDLAGLVAGASCRSLLGWIRRLSPAPAGTTPPSSPRSTTAPGVTLLDRQCSSMRAQRIHMVTDRMVLAC
ncbi:hypothetical protein GUJ93_ZPchr0005g14846 [Zizania palustris]|uniref:Uncharacterized protein n=1 Tax=Zizania palustris TaxID=103762 RepID=A0A8J5SLM4_ZIZPA|nr:hypothetical protein GUJ93_ZPchr0005g14846 [Zizania palustris]